MKNSLGKKLLPVLSLIAGATILGFSAIFVRQAEAPSAVLNLYRMGIAAGILTIPFLRQLRKDPSGMDRTGVKYAVLGGMVFSIDLILWSTGVQLSGATNPTLMANTAPLWVGLGAALFFGEKRRGIFWLGLMIALLGTFFILGLDITSSAEAGLGTALGLLGSFFYGGYFLLTQRARSSLTVIQFFWIAVVSATGVLIIATWIRGEPLFGYSPWTYWNLFALGVGVQTIGWLVINYAQGYLPAAIVSPTLLLQPVLTAVLSYFLLQEAFTLGQGISGIVVLSGVYLVHRSRSGEGMETDALEFNHQEEKIH